MADDDVALADDLFEAGSYDKALVLYRKAFLAAKKDRHHAAAVQLRMAHAHTKLGDLTNALSCARRSQVGRGPPPIFSRSPPSLRRARH